MVNIAHAALTGAELHEPKGIATAATGTVYVANGSGSGSWANVGTSSFTGMIADFTWPVVQAGWLELDGTDISTSTYSGLYGVMTISTTGTRTNASPVITSIASTATFRPGYYVFGTGFASGTTIISIDSATQITVSNNAASSGTAALAVSPWLLNTGTIRLPDVSTAGRYRRSRTASTSVGQLQADQNQAHTHTGSVSITGSSDTAPNHSHAVSINDPGHVHGLSGASSIPQYSSGGNFLNGGGTTGVASISVASAVTGITAVTFGAGTHSHAISGSGSFTTASTGATESRPTTLVVMTCVKT